LRRSRACSTARRFCQASKSSACAGAAKKETDKFDAALSGSAEAMARIQQYKAHLKQIQDHNDAQRKKLWHGELETMPPGEEDTSEDEPPAERSSASTLRQIPEAPAPAGGRCCASPQARPLV
jgi:hypothetical protein